jgi:peptidoglycan/xylan/chitin deacetylase (PgdA/CDA1 family)
MFFLLTLLLAFPSADFGQSWIRVNQLGYLPRSTKVAVFATKKSGDTPSSFELRDALTGETVRRFENVRPCGAYGPFVATLRMDFSGFRDEGAYYLQTGNVVSPAFRIAMDVYDGTADFLLSYMRQQRSGFNPFLKDSCHARDGYIIYHPTLDSTHINVAGGWHDASDYLQYVTTSANAVAQMLFAYEQHPGSFGDRFRADGLPGANGIPDILDEARWGLEWLLKMNPAPGMMFNQIADDRDHRGFRIPTLDTVDYGRGRERPVYYCTGLPQGVFQYKNQTTGIASTAGKFASAFAMASRVFRDIDPAFASSVGSRALAAYQFGREHPGVCQTAPCRAPYFYEEENWVDDMELAATQVAMLHPDSGFMQAGITYGREEKVTPWMGADTAHHYQWYPFVNLGHYFLAKGKWAGSQEFLEYMRDGLERVFDKGRRNAFFFGVPFIWCSNNLVSGLLTQARLYRILSGDHRYDEMEASLRDWLFGCNPWGTSMIVGLPRGGVTPRDPHSAFTHVGGFEINGGLVDGPVYAAIFRSLKGIGLSRPDLFSEFQSDLAVYHDDWGDYSTNEPTMDGTASLTFALASLEAEGGNGSDRKHPLLDHGGIIRMDTTKREIRLVFTGHEFANGGEAIRKTLRKHGVKASFFFTGDFYRNPGFKRLVSSLKEEGHYMGAHSDRHLLYASWEKRDSLLVTRDQFLKDLRGNYEAMSAFGISKPSAPFFLPPYQWYNDSIAAWCRNAGLTLLNFTPGTLSNADYTIPAPGARYISSDSIYRGILAYESRNPTGLNGFLLLTHIGVDPRRPDRFSDRLDGLISALKKRGYRFLKL